MRERIHATTVAIGGRGVMIMGPSGSGKSDLALRLIDRGARLVSDDYTELNVVDGVVIASPPETIAGRIEVRGVGIVAMPHLESVPVFLAVELAETAERMPEPRQQIIAGVAIPLLALDPHTASAPIKLELFLARLVESGE